MLVKVNNSTFVRDTNSMALIDTDMASYGYRVAIIGHFRKEDLVYFYLKWPLSN